MARSKRADLLGGTTRGPTAPSKTVAPLREETMLIERAPTHSLLFVDTIAAAQGPTGFVEIAALTIQNRFVSQQFKVTNDGPPQTLEAAEIKGAPVIIESVALRMTPTVALASAEILLRHLLNHKLVSKDEVQAALKASGVIES